MQLTGVPSISFPSATQATSVEKRSVFPLVIWREMPHQGVPLQLARFQTLVTLTSTSAGSVGTAAVAIDNHTITMTPGTGTGIVITGQFVVDLTIE